jgi:hypothetical protein
MQGDCTGLPYPADAPPPSAPTQCFIRVGGMFVGLQGTHTSPIWLSDLVVLVQPTSRAPQPMPPGDDYVPFDYATDGDYGAGSQDYGSAPSGSAPSGSAPPGSAPSGSVPPGSAPSGSVPHASQTAPPLNPAIDALAPAPLNGDSGSAARTPGASLGAPASAATAPAQAATDDIFDTVLMVYYAELWVTAVDVYSHAFDPYGISATNARIYARGAS